ncbi:MAG: glycosyltransferase family 2 protein [Solirubrobacterales bacterium]|nr:glycosyltransferase family 2 protein [Solirubrobacterales bacterium]MBV9473290.1 glycosyltransferase family 2 protein [Solirubrobacterales bacterium]
MQTRPLSGRSPSPQGDGGGVTAVVVCYDEDPAELRVAIDGLLAQTRPPEEILVIDNGGGRLARELDGHHESVRALVAPANLGYPPAVNLAAAHAAGEYLLCLNPDAEAEPDCLERLVESAARDPKVALVGAQILLEDHQTRNAGANPVHPTGISPAGGYGLPREDGEPRDVLVVSGACCLIRRSVFLELGGFVEEFFMYYDDVDLGWRANMAGYRVVYDPRAVVSHAYAFARRGKKWLYLERNRLFTVIANYQPRTLLLLAPLLLASEAGLLVVAALGGWLPQKLAAYAWLVRMRSRLREHRRDVARSRRRSDAELLSLFEPRLHSALLPAAGARLANAFAVPYLRIVRRLAR